MDETFRERLRENFGDVPHVDEVVTLFRAARRKPELEYLAEKGPVHWADHLERFAAGGSLVTGWNKWIVIQGRSETPMGHFKL